MNGGKGELRRRSEVGEVAKLPSRAKWRRSVRSATLPPASRVRLALLLDQHPLLISIRSDTMVLFAVA